MLGRGRPRMKRRGWGRVAGRRAPGGAVHGRDVSHEYRRPEGVGFWFTPPGKTAVAGWGFSPLVVLQGVVGRVQLQGRGRCGGRGFSPAGERRVRVIALCSHCRVISGRGRGLPWCSGGRLAGRVAGKEEVGGGSVVYPGVNWRAGRCQPR